MKPEILHNDHMMFLDRALETQRTALLTAMADAVSECRTAADQAAAADATIKLNIFFPADNINAAARMKTPLCGSIFYLMIKYADDISSHYRSCKYRISFFFFLVLMYSLPHLLEHR